MVSETPEGAPPSPGSATASASIEERSARMEPPRIVTPRQGTGGCATGSSSRSSAPPESSSRPYAPLDLETEETTETPPPGRKGSEGLEPQSLFTPRGGRSPPASAGGGTTGGSSSAADESPVMGSTGRVSTVMQTQRWIPVLGWGKKRLPTDPPEWVDMQGQPRPRDSIQPPPRCRWTSEWEVDKSTVPDSEGWHYATDWWLTFHSPTRTGDCVRRRKWCRQWARADTAELEVTIVRKPGEILGLVLDNLRLLNVKNPSTAHTHGCAQFIGRKLTSVNGQLVTSDKEVGDVAKSAAAKIHLRFDEIETETVAAPPQTLHKQFPELESEERAVGTFQCNLGGHRVGKMYITPKHLCFYSVMCDPVTVSHEKVESVEKRSTWGLIDGINVVLKGGETMQFTAFLAGRDTVYDLLNHVIQMNRLIAAKHGDAAAGAEEDDDDAPTRIATGLLSPDDPELTTAPGEAPASAAKAQKQLGSHVVTADVTVFQGPEEESTEVRKITSGTIVEVGEVTRGGKWAKITQPCEGWVELQTEAGKASLVAMMERGGGGKEGKYAELRKLFPDLGAEVRLLNDFQCSYRATKIDRLGRMWITQTAICFSSPLLSPPLLIHFEDIADVTKRPDLLFLSAIVILTNSGSFVFTAFLHRDQAWKLIRDIWLQHHKKKGRDPQELVKEARSRQAAREEEKRQSRRKNKESKTLTPTPIRPPSPDEAFVPVKAVGVPAAETTAAEAHTLFAGSPLAAHFCDESVLLAINPMVPPEKLPEGTTLERVFDVLFKERAGYLTEVKTGHGEYSGKPGQPVEMPPWTYPDPGGLTHCGDREIVCTTVVQAPWSTHTRFVERQRYSCIQGPPRALLYHTSAQTPDVMTGDCFRCEALIAIEETEPGVCTIRVHGHVPMLKSTMLRGKIQSTALPALESSHKSAVALAQNKIARAVKGSAARAAGAEAQPAPPAPPPASGGGWMDLLQPFMSAEVAAGVGVGTASILSMWALASVVSEHQRASEELSALSLALGSPGNADPIGTPQPPESLSIVVVQLLVAMIACAVAGGSLAAVLLLRTTRS
eukprot:Hpha_TRINITY_DN17220_c0_g1::TRINITY_DN17220_c0_g1_i1::g.17877::m.17877